MLAKAKRTDPQSLADAFARERDVILNRASELAAAIEQLRSGARVEDVVDLEGSVPEDGPTAHEPPKPVQ